MTDQPLTYTRDESIAIVTINDAPYNRMSLEFMDALEERVQQIAQDPHVRAWVITGAGDEHFSVGMNLKQLPEGIKRMGSADALFDQRLRVIAAIENMGKPSVATLYGFCLGWWVRATAGMSLSFGRRSRGPNRFARDGFRCRTGVGWQCSAD